MGPFGFIYLGWKNFLVGIVGAIVIGCMYGGICIANRAYQGNEAFAVASIWVFELFLLIVVWSRYHKQEQSFEGRFKLREEHKDETPKGTKTIQKGKKHQTNIFDKDRTMADWDRVKLELEANKKSGWIAAILNLMLPGAGYIYCRRIILGIFVLLIGVFLLVGTFTIPGVGAFYGTFALIMIVDGFLCAGRYNKKAITAALAQDRSDEKPSSLQNLDALTKLAELKEKGILSEEEFQAQKAKLLSS